MEQGGQLADTTAAAAGSLRPDLVATVADPVLAAMRAQYTNQAKFHVGVHNAVLETTAKLQTLSSCGPAAPQAAGSSPKLGLLPATVGLLAQAAATAKTMLESQSEKKMLSQAQETAARFQKMKEEKAMKEVQAQEEAERRRCHLHKRPKDGCKFCQRHKDFVTKDKEDKAAIRDKFLKDEEDKAAIRDKFLSDVRKQGRGENKSDEFRAMLGPLEIANPKTFGLPPLLQSHIVESTHFKTLMELKDLDDIIDEINNFAESVEPYLQNSTTLPSALFCCVYRLLSMGLNGQQLRRLVENEDNPYIRCTGFLFVRFGLAPDQLWPWLGEYVLDDEILRPTKDAESTTTVGEFVEGLLTQERYFTTVLPRLPMSTKRQIEVHLAPVPQYRKRTQANLRLRDVYCQRGVRIEICMHDDDWRAGEVVELLEASPSRPKLRVKLSSVDDDEGEVVVVHLGRVILADSGYSTAAGFSRGSRKRSRSRSPVVDWAREKGRPGAELLDELRRRVQERAVCTSGKDYARRPVSFKVALPMEQGNASHRLIQDETYVPVAKRGGGSGEHRERSRSPEPTSIARREHSVEYRARMKQLFEKYGMAKGAEDVRQQSDLEGPDVMYLG